MVCTAVAFVLFFRLITEVGPARASVITYINPAVAVTLGVSVLGEPFTLAMACAFALILGGSVLATRRGQGQARRRRASLEPERCAGARARWPEPGPERGPERGRKPNCLAPAARLDSPA